MKETIQGVNIKPPKCNCRLAVDRDAEKERIRSDADCNKNGMCRHLISGSVGHIMYIYTQESDGKLNEVLYITMRLLNSDNPIGYEAFTVLYEKADGYYAIVTIGANRILRYDMEIGQYKFYDGE